MTQSIEAREFSRSPVQTRVEVRLKSGVLVEGCARDVSMNGVWFCTERSLPVGNQVRVSVVLGGGASEQRIETVGSVVRVDEGGVAIGFTKIDAESVDHLRNLVLYNADDAEKVDQEFRSHVGLKRRR